MRSVRVYDPCRDPLAVRGWPCHQDLGAVRREAWAAAPLAEQAYVGSVGRGFEDLPLAILTSFSGEEDLAVKVLRPRRGGIRTLRTAATSSTSAGTQCQCNPADNK